MLRIGLIGCGAHCIEAHAPALIDFAERHPATIALAAACDLDHTRAEDFVRRYGFAAAYTDVGEMLAAERLDGALSIMPVDRIVDTSLYLFECGMPCIIEKPLATTIADLDRLRTAARSAAAPHQVSLNRRFMPMAIKALAWCRDRGPVVKVNGRILRHRRTKKTFLWSTGIHVVDMCCHIVGEIASYHMRRLEAPSLESNWYDITLNFPGGAQGHIEMMPTAGWREETYEILGDGYRVLLSDSHLQAWEDGVPAIDERVPEAMPVHERDGSLGELAAFVAALGNGSMLHPTVDDAYGAMRCCLEMAAETGVLHAGPE